MYSSIIRVENLIKAYSGYIAINDVSFSINKGDVYGILGHNGAGKTTTMRLLLGLLKPDYGTIKVLSENPYGDSTMQRSIRTRIGVLLEKDALYPNLTGWDNLAYWAQLYGYRKCDIANIVDSVIELVGIRNRCLTLVRTYSKGMCRQLSIARALLGKPELLYLDEPTSGLDPIARVHVRQILANIVSSGQCTIFLCSHDLEEVQKLCNRVLVIRNGKEIASGYVEELTHHQPEVVIQLKHDFGSTLPEGIRMQLEQIESITSFTMVCNKLYIRLLSYDIVPTIVTAIVSCGALIESIEHSNTSLETMYYSISKSSDTMNMEVKNE